MQYNLKQLHAQCGWHEKSVLGSRLCGCFHCLSIFLASDIVEWIDEPENSPRGSGRTALCPNCGIDSVLPESEHYSLTKELLEKMNREWF